ncbi:MAG: hypothetical protein M3178_11330 [Pseudomonadota bacterium]|nr:hypothetical protein [Pseudomonadota bacterium]
MSHRKQFFFIAVLSLAICAPARAGDLPRRVGECVNTTIKSVGTRLDTPGSGSALSFENGGDQVGYETVPAIEQSRKGDPVRICLISLPIPYKESGLSGCPKGDNRGSVYRTTNLRTHKTWTMADSAHMCGGA